MNRKTWRTHLVGAALLMIAGTTPAAALGIDTVINGEALLPDGSPAAGATVTLTELTDNPPAAGQTYTEEALATAEVDDSGLFEIEIPTTDGLVGRAQQNDGVLNLQLLVTLDSGPEEAALAPVGDALSAGTFGYNVLMAYGALAVDTGAAGKGIVLTAPNDVRLTLGTFLAQPLQGNDPDYTRGRAMCTSVTVLGHEYPQVVIGELHSYWDTRVARFQYGRTADSDLGFGVSQDDKVWKVSGEVHSGTQRSSAVGITDLGGYYGKQLTSQFHYVKERGNCNSGGKAWYWYRIRQVKWTGGIMVGNDVSGWDGSWGYNHSHCGAGCVQPFAANSDFVKIEGEGYTYTGEIFAFGVKLSARSGWSESVTASWEFGPSSTRPHYLMGKDGSVVDASIIYAY